MAIAGMGHLGFSALANESVGLFEPWVIFGLGRDVQANIGASARNVTERSSLLTRMASLESSHGILLS